MSGEREGFLRQALQTFLDRREHTSVDSREPTPQAIADPASHEPAVVEEEGEEAAEIVFERKGCRLASLDAINHEREVPGGGIDAMSEEQISGWCANPLDLTHPVKLQLRLFDDVLAEFSTDIPRVDVAQSFGAQTTCGFVFKFAQVSDASAHRALASHGERLFRSRSQPADLWVCVRNQPVELPRWQNAGALFSNAALLHLLHSHQHLGTIGWFDADWYSAQNPIVRKLGFDPHRHYVDRGWMEGLPPNRVIAAKLGQVGIRPQRPAIEARVAAQLAELGLFEVAWYCERYDVPEHQAISHYVSTGAFRGYDPSPFFSSLDYMTKHVESVKAGQNPLEHFIRTTLSDENVALLSEIRLTTDDWLKGL